MDAIADVSCYGWLAVASVNDAFVSFDVNFDVGFAETAPVFLD